MFIVEVIPRLYLADLEAVNSSSVVVEGDGFALLLSIGCVSNKTETDSLKILTFPQFNDEPNVYMISLWKELSRCITHCIDVEKNSVVVHCVYGQSRSVSTVLAYLLLSKQCSSLDDAMTLLHAKQPAWSINPGFLAQLRFFNDLYLEEDVSVFSVHRLLAYQYRDYNLDNSSAIKKYLESSHVVEEESPNKRRKIDESSIRRNVVCKACKGVLAMSSDLVQQSYDYTEFIHQHQDEFWKYYPVPKAVVGNTVPMKGHHILHPLDWMLQQINTATNRIQDEVAMTCPHCQYATVGIWKRKYMNIIGAYLPCDLFALLQSATVLKRCHADIQS